MFWERTLLNAFFVDQTSRGSKLGGDMGRHCGEVILPALVKGTPEDTVRSRMHVSAHRMFEHLDKMLNQRWTKKKGFSISNWKRKLCWVHSKLAYEAG